MLPDIAAFFGDVTPQGAVGLLVIGLLTGFGFHDLVVNTIAMASQWYATRHDPDD